MVNGLITNIWYVLICKVRFTSLLIILFSVGVCNYSSFGNFPIISPSVEIEQIATSTPTAGFAQTVATPTAVPNEEETAQEQIAAGRSFQDGLPLVARVNDEPIFLKTYEKQVTQFEHTLKSQGVDIASDDGQAMFNQIRKQVLDGLLEQAIIEQQAQRLGIIIAQEEVEAKAQENIAQLQDQAQFEAWLATNDLTYQEFLANLQSQLVANEMFEYVTQDVSKTADQIQLRYIRVEEEATAQTIIEGLKTGESFAGLADQYSLDDDTQNYPGWFPKAVGLLPSEVETIAFSLQIGEVSGPIPTSLGFYIIKLENKEADRPLAPEMLQVLKKQIFEDWLMELRSSAAIEIYVEM